MKSNTSVVLKQDVSSSSPSNMQSQDKPAASKLATGILLSFAIIGFLATLSFVLPFLGDSTPADKTPIAEVSSKKAVLDSGEQLTLEAEEYLNAFAWAARTKLEDLQLNHRLQAGISSNGLITVKGDISNGELPRWNSFLQWYGEKEGFPSLEHDVNTRKEITDLPQIQSIWFDSPQTVFFQDGSFGNIGSEITDGWKIVNIDDLAVIIERNGAILSLTY